MLQRHENLMKMGSKTSEMHLNTMIMSSLPESYRPTLQTITASERASALTSPGSSTQRKMEPSDPIMFLIEEAQHHIINNERSQNLDQALAAHVKRKGKGKATWAKGDEKALNADSTTAKRRAIRRLTVGWKGEARKGKVPSKRKAKGRSLRQQLLRQWTMTIKS